MTVIFKARTSGAYFFKICIELLSNNLRTGCFKIDKTGLNLRMEDHHHTMMVDLFLEADNFTVYKFKSDEPRLMGINLGHFHKLLKSVKKKDSMQLSIDSENPTELQIRVIPKEHNRVTTSTVTIQEKQAVFLSIPAEYKSPVNIPSTDFQKMIKDLATIGKDIKVAAKRFHMMFRCDAGSIIKRDVEFGEANNSDSDSDSDEDEDDLYDHVFKTDQFTRVTKLANLGNIIQIYPANGMPLKLHSKVGDLGVIDIYIKSQSDLEMERLERAALHSDSEEDYE
jgi:proliferating cell nuclear antigen